MSEHNETPNVTELRSSITGRLPTYSEIGGYSLYYFDTAYNVLCADCANDNDNYSVPLCGYDINWEAIIYCEHCSKLIPSSYGESD